MTKTVVAIVYEETEPKIPGGPEKFMAYWQSLLDMVPVEYRASTSISIEALDVAEMHVRVTYKRPETQYEENMRMLNESKRAARRLEQDRAELARLKELLE